MYPRPVIPHGFNHQSYYRQPVLNLRPINQIVWNGNQSQQQMGPISSSSFSSVHDPSLASKPVNFGHSIRLALTDQTKPQIERRQDPPDARKSSNNGVNYPHGNESTTNGFAASARTGHVLDQKSNNGITTNGVGHRQASSRVQSVGSESSRTNMNSTGATPLPVSRSAGALNDYIQRERRAHTMAPLTRIVGPSSTPTVRLFASTVAPSDAKAMKSALQNQSQPDTTTNTLSKPMVIRNDVTTDDDHQYDETDATADDYDDDIDDDDAPIIVKVRYDPDAGAPPSEDLIRQAVDNRLKGSSGPRTGNDPLILDFRNDTVPPSAPQMLTRQQQPGSPPSRSTDAAGSSHASLFNTVPSRQQQPTQPNPQLLQRQRQFLQEQQQRQQQQQQALVQQQSLMQRQKHQEQERQQQVRLMEEKQRQQQLLRYQQLEQQQKLLLQQQKEKQQLEQFLQQQKQQQLRQRLQQEQLQKQQLKDYQMQQQRYREQLFRQQQYQQNQQRLQPQSDRMYQQTSQSTLFESQRNQQNPYLPPMGARPPQAPSAGRSFPVVRPPSIIVPTAHLPSTQMFPRAPLSFVNPSQVQNITIERLPTQNVKPGLNTSHSHTGLNSLSNYAQKYIGSTFIPINFQLINGQPSISMNGDSSATASNHIPQRPQTAPSSAEIYRPASVLDIPELSQNSLRNMLSQLPGLGGRQFSFEYVPPTQPEGYQIPIDADESLNRYPEAAIVDQLPKNIVRHVQSGNNQAPATAVNHPIPPSTALPSPREKITRVVTSNGALHHKRAARPRVKQSPPSSVDDRNSTRQPSSTESIQKNTRAFTYFSYRRRIIK